MGSAKASLVALMGTISEWAMQTDMVIYMHSYRDGMCGAHGSMALYRSRVACFVLY